MNNNQFNNTDREMRLPKLNFKRGGGLYRYKQNLNGWNICLLCKKRKALKPCDKCDRLELRLEYDQVTYTEIYKSIFDNLSDTALQTRLEEYLEEIKMADKKFCSLGHKERFERTLKNINKKNKSLVATIYLLTADSTVWRQCWNKVMFDSIEITGLKLKQSGNNGYVYFCAAKDLYLGSHYISAEDLADRDVIPKNVFGTVCNAIAINRYGLKSLYITDKGRSDDTHGCRKSKRKNSQI